MSAWLDRWGRRYADRLRLLVEFLQVLTREPRKHGFSPSRRD